MPRLHSYQILPCDPSPPLPPLASCCCPHPIQEDGAGLQGHQRNCTRLPPTLVRPHIPARALRSSTSAGRLTESKLSSLSEVTIILCFGASVVEQTPDRCQESGFTLHPLQKPQDSFVQTSPRSRIASPPPKKIDKKIESTLFVYSTSFIACMYLLAVMILRWGLVSIFILLHRQRYVVFSLFSL